VQHKVAVAPQLKLKGDHHVIVEIMPAKKAPIAILVCFPGGGCSRGYFNLSVAEDASYSFAKTMAAKGFTVVLLDHLGAGESSKPADPMLLDIALLSAVNNAALRQSVELLRRHFPSCPMIAVGHSMGAMLAVQQQARYLEFDGLALLGFSNKGLPAFFEPLGIDPVVENLALLTRAAFGNNYQTLPMFTLDGRESRVDKKALAALNDCQTAILPLPAIWSMIPNASLDQCAKIEIPVLIINGDQDIAQFDDAITEDFPHSPGLTLLELNETKHLHFIYESRYQLYEALEQWASRLF
jgi:pimeloyl-ACP methyl ester carboxylesterase